MNVRLGIGVALAAALGLGGCDARSAPVQPSLRLEAIIPLVGVRGRIDHLALDAGHRRLFVAELGNGAVESVDLATGRSLGRIRALSEPQGLAYLAEADLLAVATGGDGHLRLYGGGDLAFRGAIKLGDDADNVRVASGGRLVVGYGAGALAVVDPATRQLVARIALPAHPEGFQLAAGRAYVNLPDAGRTAVVDLASGRELQTWPGGLLRFNVPLAFAPPGQVAIAFRLPSRLALYDAATGGRRQVLATCGDADDIAVDRRRERLYVTCGSGAVDVFQGAGAAYRRVERIDSRPGARTGLFSPELDRLFVAARAGAGGPPAAILVYRPS